MVNIENRKHWKKILATTNEAQKRRFAGAMAIDLGWGGISAIAKLTGMSHTTIRKGKKELQDMEEFEEMNRIRKPGGGRKNIEEKDPQVIEDLEEIMDENTIGDPMSVLKWTIKSTYKIAEELNNKGHKINRKTVARLLKKMDYSLQANLKTKEGGFGPERDAQFRYINEIAKKYIKNRDPVISVDTKKRELVGEFKNAGRTWRKKGQPPEVYVYDFPSMAIGIAIPYGIYDDQRNEGFVNVGISCDTSEFAVESIRQWWNIMGKYNYPNARGLLICCDGGGSNGSRRRGWKIFLQEFVDQIKKPITVCHLPPGTSKWNKIEHRMFSFISIHWKGQPLINYETILKLIGDTTTKKGLKIMARFDEKEYENGLKFLDEDMAKLKIQTHSMHPKWNYSILPTSD